MKRINLKMFFGILVTALVLAAMAAPAKAATWDSTNVYYATTVIKYDVAVGSKLKGPGDDTVRVLTTQSASPYYVLLSTDRSLSAPMNWVTETVWTNTVAMRGCAIGDVDGDGQNEIIVGNTATPFGLKMIKWNGSAWVATTVVTTTNTYVGAIYDVAIGDADNNAGTANDIIFNNASYGVMKARWNGATFDTTRLYYNSTPSTYYGVAIGDFDATYAGVEIVAVTYGQYVYRIRWTGAAWDATQIYYNATDYDFYDVAVGDFDASNPGDEIAINNGYSAANAGVYELYGSGASWTYAGRYVPGSGWSSSGEIAVGDFYSGNAGAEIVAVSGSGSSYEARLVYGSGGTWFNEKIMGAGGATYGVAIGNVNRYHTGNELAVGGNYRVWEAEEYIPVANDMTTMSIDNPPAGSTFFGGNAVGIQATVKNLGTVTQNQVPVNLLITDGVSYTYTDVESTGTLVQNATQVITFAPNWTVPNATANYTITVTTALASDQNTANDAKSTSVSGFKTGYTVQDFSGTTFPPEDWTAYNFDGGDPWVRYTTFYHTSPACAEIYYDLPNNDWLITPRIAVQSGDVLNFWWRTQSTSYTESLFVRVSTNSTVSDTGSYSIIDKVWSTGNASWFNKQISLSGYAGQNVYIAFYYRAYNTLGMAIDDVILPPRYYPTNDVGVTKVFEPPAKGHVYKTATPDSIGLEVRNFGTATQSNFYVHYDLIFDEGRDSVLHTASLAFGIRDTIYAHWTPEHVGTDTIYGWTALSGDEVPGNDKSKLTVNINTAGMVFYEDFSGTTFPPAGWTVYNFDGGDAWARYTTYFHSAPACAYIYYDLPNNDWLIMPNLTVQSGNKLNFWWRTYSTSYTETLFVRVSTSATVSDTGSYSIIDKVWSTGNISWFNKEIDLSGYADRQNVYIAFYYRANNTYGMLIDDVMVYAPGPRIAISPPDSLVIPMVTDQILDTSLFISNVGGGSLTYSIAENPDTGWITENPTSGDVPGASTDSINLHLNATGYGLGTYRTVLGITSNSETKGIKAHDYVPIIMKIGGPHVSVAPESLHVGFCPPATKDTSVVLTSNGTESLIISGVKVVQTSPKSVNFYMGTMPKEEPQTGKDEAGLTNEENLKRKMEFKSGGPDIFGHYWIDSDDPGGPTFNWIEISGTGTQIIGLGDDTNLGPYPIGFNFNFYGTNFSDIRVCSNGWFSFTSTATGYTNYALPNASAPENMFAIFWDDMNFNTSGSAYYQTIGDKFIIEYKDAARYSTGELFTYEMILDETCGTITYQYLSMQPGNLNSATIGIQNALKNDGLTMAYNEAYVHDSLAIRIQTNPLWVSIDPCQLIDTLAIGESDVLGVTFNTGSSISGTFRGEIQLTTNAPGQFTKVIPLAMDLLAPAVTVTPPSITDSCLEGGSASNVINIQNSGYCPLTFSIAPGCAWVSVAPNGGSLNPGQNMNVTVNQDCHDLLAGNYVCELRISSNDPGNQPYKIVNIYKHVGPDPDIAVSPDSFYVELYSGVTKDTAMNIANTGNGHLVWGAAIQEYGKAAGDTILYEGFEGTFPPSGWTVVNNDGGTQAWVQYTTAHTGTYSAACRWESSTLWNDDWLITPQINIGSNDTLSFWYMAYSTSFPESLEVRLSTSTNNISAFTTLLWAGSQLTNLTWLEKKIELGKYSRGKVYIAFVYKGLDEFRIMIDDVLLTSYAGPWLTVNPLSDIVEPHSNKLVNVSFSSIGYMEEKYANIFIASNDPDESMVAVKAHMKIVGPEYSISPKDTLIIDALEGQYTDGHLYVTNTGFGPLFYKMTDPVSWLSEIPDTSMILLDSTLDVVVRVDGNILIAGDYSTKIAIKTNDFDEPFDTIDVIVHMGPPPDISVAPESLRVTVPGGSTSDATLTINNNGDGHLGFDITTEETGPKAVSSINNRQSEILESHRTMRLMQSNVPVDQNDLSQLSGVGTGEKLLAAPGAPLKFGGDTVYVQWPHSPTDSWSFGTSDAGAGYKIYDNFWGVTLPIKTIEWWGLCLKYNGSAWVAGNPDNLRFNVIFYSDPASDPTMPPNQTACTFTNVAPTVVHTGIMFTTSAGTFEMIKFTGLDVNPLCNLPEGWASIQSQSAGSGYDWFLWASALSNSAAGDSFSYQEGSTTPSTIYDRGMLMLGGAAWLSVAPEADTVNPQSSTDVNVHFDATNILGGDKYGNIIIASNDPDKAPVIVRAHMIVAGANYSVHPLELDINALEGQITPANLMVSNPGGIGTLSFKMTWTAPWLTAIPDTADVPPDGSQNVTVRIDGNQLIAGDYYTEIMVKTNAANQQLDTIPVYVHVGPDPDIALSAASMRVSVPPACNLEVPLRVTNSGGGHLAFTTEIESGKAEFVSIKTKRDQQLDQVFGKDKHPYASLPPAGTPIGRNGDVAPQLAPSSSGKGLNDNSHYTKADVLLSEGFEGSWLPTGWTMIQNNYNYQGTNPCFWSQMSNYAHSGTYSAGLWWDYYYQDEWLITPTFTAGAACTLSFWTYGYLGSTYGDHYYVMVTTNNGANWTPVFDLSALSGGWNYYASPFYVDLSAYAGQSVKLAWYAQDPTTDDGIWYAWLIDDVLVTSSGPPPPTCPFTLAPEADTLEPLSFFDLILSFDPEAFEECSEETVTCNIVFTTNDPDEPTLTVPVSAWFGRGDVFTPSCLVDVGDVVFLLNYILKGGPAPSPICVGDVAQPHDDMVDMSDLIYLLQYLYSAGTPPAVTPAVTPTPMQR